MQYSKIVGNSWGVTCLGQKKRCSHTPHNTQCTPNNLNITQAKQIHQSTNAQTRKTCYACNECKPQCYKDLTILFSSLVDKYNMMTWASFNALVNIKKTC